MSGASGNIFCFSKSLDGSQYEVAGKIQDLGKTKLFPKGTGKVR